MLFDASVLVPLFVTETSSASVTTLIDAIGVPVISDFALGEVCSAISIRLRRHEINASEAEEILSDLDAWTERSARRVTIEPRDIAQATRFVRRFELGLRMPDALHLALAQRLNAPIATQDRRQAAAAAKLGLRVVTPHTS